MKNMLLPVLLLLSIITNAQFQKGDKTLGGTISFSDQDASNSPGSKNKYVDLSILPSVGFLMNEHFAIGGQLGYSFDYQKNENSTPYFFKRQLHTVSVGIFAKRYFIISEKFLFFMAGDLSFSRGTQKDTQRDFVTEVITETTTQNYNLALGFRPGFIFLPSPQWGIEASIGSVSGRYSKNLSTNESNNFISVYYGSIALGLTYYLRKSAE